MTTVVHAGIFKAYDIRGLYGTDIDAGAAELIGRAFARVIAELEDKPTTELRLGLGRDMRLTAPELASAYCRGMCAEGATVLDAGEVGTEMLYYLVGSRDLDGGLMCTASHNPSRYTGAKLVKRGAIALSGDAGIGEVRAKIEAGLDGRPGGGSVEHVRLYEEFQQAALEFIEPDHVKPMRVVVDGGNGMAGPMVGPLLRELGLDLIESYWEPNGHFPDHEPNPLLPENREFIMREVVRRRADLGIAWDGDADRCFFIDDRGSFVDGDFLTALLAESLLSKELRPPTHPTPPTILYDVRASRAVADTTERHGGRALMNRVGHAFFKTRMREESARSSEARCPATTTFATSTVRTRNDPGAADPRAALRARRPYVGAARALPIAPLHLRDSNSEVADPDAKMKELASRYENGRQYRAGRHLGRVRRLALQRPPLEHRAADSPVPGVTALTRGHGASA